MAGGTWSYMISEVLTIWWDLFLKVCNWSCSLNQVWNSLVCIVTAKLKFRSFRALASSTKLPTPALGLSGVVRLILHDSHGTMSTVQCMQWSRELLSVHTMCQIFKKLNPATNAISLITLITIFSCLELVVDLRIFLKAVPPIVIWQPDIATWTLTHDGRSTLQCQDAQTPDENFMKGQYTILTLTFRVFLHTFNNCAKWI